MVLQPATENTTGEKEKQQKDNSAYQYKPETFLISLIIL